jgi:DNA primase
MKKSNSDKEWSQLLDDLQYLKQSVDPRFLVEGLGFKVVRETKKELRGPCAIHGGDNKTSFRFNKITRSWVCFSHGCHNDLGSDIVGLIRAKTGKTFMEAVQHLRDLVGDVSSDKVAEFKRRREREAFIDAYSDVQPSIDERVTETKLKVLIQYRSDYFIDKGYTKETLENFEIGGGYVDDHGITREVIPIRSADGVLLAYSLRDRRDHVSEDYKYIFTEGFDKDNVLYNLHRAQKHLKGKPLILVEGYKSVWRLHQYGINNVVAVMGSSITPGQESLIHSYAMNGVVIMFDNDIPGVTGAVKGCKELGKKVNVEAVFMTEVDDDGKGLDPSDLSYEQVHGYLKNYI